jgi:hypothetical protein
LQQLKNSTSLAMKVIRNIIRVIVLSRFISNKGKNRIITCERSSK